MGINRTIVMGIIEIGTHANNIKIFNMNVQRTLSYRLKALRIPRVRSSTPMTMKNYYQPIRFNSSKSGNPEPKQATQTEQPQESEEPKEATDTEEPQNDDPIVQLESKLAEKDKQLAEMKNHYAKAIADFRNLQESTKKEIQKARDFALQKFAKDLIVSLDNFGLALESVKHDTLQTNAEIKNFYDGVEMTRSVFEKTLNTHGIAKIDPVGEPFDPNRHEAAFEVPQPDKEPGTVFHVQQPGYTLNSRVLRPAKVGIVKGTD